MSLLLASTFIGVGELSWQQYKC